MKIELTYKGVVCSKKNSKQIIRTKAGIPRIISNATARANEEEMVRQFEAQAIELASKNAELSFIAKRDANKVKMLTDATAHNERYVVNIEIYAPNAVRRDLDNQATSIFDALVRAGILADDCFKFLRAFSVKFAGIDKFNPRAVIQIEVQRD